MGGAGGRGRGPPEGLAGAGAPVVDRVPGYRAVVTSAPPATRDEARARDDHDPLAAVRSRFAADGAEPVYLDGNSLGRQPLDAPARVAAALEQWRTRLVGGWDEWIERPGQVGDRVGRLLGAAAGQVVISDSTTVNLYKLASAALDARPDRPVIVADPHDFPTVRYVLQGLAERTGRRLRWVGSDPAGGWVPDASAAGPLGDDVALVCLSGVNFRSGAVLDLRAAAAAAHAAGALTLWDLSHAAGCVPVDLDGDGADLAVGCTYKYLNAGPGAPAWLYVREELQSRLRQPIWGWWGQRDQFAMGERYDPVAGIDRFQAGTPPIVGVAAVEAGIQPLLEVGIEALWRKTAALVALLAARVAARLEPLGARIASPGDPARRGGHLAVAHPRAWPAVRLLIEQRRVVADFRPPDVMRLAPVAAYTRYVDVWDAVEHIAEALADPRVQLAVPARRVT